MELGESFVSKEGRICSAGQQDLGRREAETTTIKANPATGAGFGRRSSCLSHAWCGPFRAGRRGFGYCVTGSNVRLLVAHFKRDDRICRLLTGAWQSVWL